jgi:hypothetical protein
MAKLWQISSKNKLKAIHNKVKPYKSMDEAVANIVKEQIVPKGCFQQKQFTTAARPLSYCRPLWQISSKNKLSQRDAFSKSNSQQRVSTPLLNKGCGKYRQRTNCPKGMLSAKAIHNR